MPYNTNYGGVNATRQGLGYTFEVMLSKQWKLLAEKSTPLLLRMLQSKDRFNKIQTRGDYALLPVWDNTGPGSGSTGYGGILQGSTTAVAGVARTYAARATPRPMMVNDGTHLEFIQSYYDAFIGWDIEDERNYAKASTEGKAVMIEGRIKQVMKEFNETLAYDLGTATVGSKTKLCGLGFLVSNTGTFGNIDRATYANLQSYVLTAGAWNRDTMNKTLRVMKDTRSSIIDLIVFSTSSGSADNWEKMLGIYEAQTMIMDFKTSQDWGSDVYKWRGATLVGDQWQGDNKVFFLNTSDLYAWGDLQPQDIYGTQPLPQTSMQSQGKAIFLGLAGYPQTQARWDGATA